MPRARLMNGSTSRRATKWSTNKSAWLYAKLPKLRRHFVVDKKQSLEALFLGLYFAL